MIKKNYFLVIVLSLLTMNISLKLLAQERAVEVSSIRNSDKSVDILYQKNKPGSYTIKVKFSNITNTFVSDYEDVIQYDSGTLLTLRPQNSNQDIGYSYNYSYSMGNQKPKVDSLFQYLLPFKKGKKVTVYESTNLNEEYFGAEKLDSWKSYHITSTTADSIFAMRKGIVVELKNEYQTDTITNMVYTSKKNTLIIEHEDGTYAAYKGLKKDSFKVKLGDIVYPSTMLGVLDRFNNKRYVLHFNIYYHDLSRNVDNTNATLKTAKSRYAFIAPYFFTKEGLIKIVPKSSFTAETKETIIRKEMSKKEIKQQMKNEI
ncbi:M23 family metallopeptidase [Flavobacterium sp. 7A]|uniref:M23 family metallopeptidase n=1 Tax=Flavobacterium sp. 7A TaxID=2940571 RepID=UPI002227FE3C|nr:M23 family metallopeptidase [Flavobacterium sp. 7A]MCW2118376.1 hypothetical protein [Flavobacterium sp. 7A]